MAGPGTLHLTQQSWQIKVYQMQTELPIGATAHEKTYVTQLTSSLSLIS